MLLLLFLVIVSYCAYCGCIFVFTIPIGAKIVYSFNFLANIEIVFHNWNGIVLK